MDSFEKYMDMSLEELEEARKEINAAIKNEMIWGLGARNAGECNLHAQNMANLGVELKFVTELIKEVRNVREDLG